MFPTRCFYAIMTAEFEFAIEKIAFAKLSSAETWPVKIEKNLKSDVT